MCSPVEEVGNISSLADVVGRIGKSKNSLDMKTQGNVGSWRF